MTQLYGTQFARNDDVNVWIYNFKWTDEYILQHYYADEWTMTCARGCAFVVVIAHIDNIGNDVVISGAKRFTAVDSDGRKYYSKSIDDYNLMPYSTSISPGDSLANDVIFEVPADADGLQIQYYIGDNIGTASWSIQR